MFNFILRFFSFGMFTCLRIAVALTHNTYSMAMDIFFIMADTLRINLALPYPDSISNANRNARQIAYINHMRPNSSLSHTYTQTEECVDLENNQRERSSNTDIFIYNLDSSKKLTITHRNVDYNSMSKNSEDQYQSSKPQVKHSRIQSIKHDCPSLSHVENELSNSCPYFSSNMSIENEVSDGQILCFSPIAEEVKGYSQSSKSTEGNQTDNCENKSDDTIDESNFEVDSQKTQVLETKHEDSTREQKTSSPIRKSTRLAFFDPCNQIENSSLRKKWVKEDLSSETSDESPITDGEETSVNYFENTILLNDSARRRLSLPASFNTSSGTFSLYKEIKNQIAEAVNTSRHEKSVRDIKYPLLSETFLARDNEESKEVFSCSSYESLPVSEHLNNAFENNKFFSLCREDCVSDFSSVDAFVEAVNKMKSTLSVSEQIKNKIPVPFSICKESKGEVKKLMKGRSYEMHETNVSHENYSNSLNNTIFKNISKDKEIQSKNNEISDLLISARKLNSSPNSIDLKTECVSSAHYEIDHESRNNYLMTCSDEEFSEEMHHMIESVFDKMLAEIDDQIEPRVESAQDNFVETKSCSFQSTLTEPLQFQQDQTIIEIAGTLPSQGQNSIDKKIDIDESNKLAELSPDETSENTKEIHFQIPVTIFEKQEIVEPQNTPTDKSGLENTQLVVRLPNEKTSEFIPPPKAILNTEVIAPENDERLDESLTSITETDSDFKMGDLSKRPIEDDHDSIAMKIDNIECDDGKRVISTTRRRNDSLGNDEFLSFVEENFYMDSNLEDSTRTLKELTCN